MTCVLRENFRQGGSKLPSNVGMLCPATKVELPQKLERIYRKPDRTFHNIGKEHSGNKGEGPFKGRWKTGDVENGVFRNEENNLSEKKMKQRNFFEESAAKYGLMFRTFRLEPRNFPHHFQT